MTYLFRKLVTTQKGQISAASLLVSLVAVTGCSAPTVLSTPNSCSTLLPSSWKDGVAGAELPGGDTVAEWIAFGDAQTGKLDQANGRTKDAIEVVERCERRDSEAVRRSTKSWLGRLFD